MRVLAGNGVEIHTANGQVLHLDPKKTTPGSVVTHGHADHLTPQKGGLGGLPPSVARPTGGDRCA